MALKREVRSAGVAQPGAWLVAYEDLGQQVGQPIEAIGISSSFSSSCHVYLTLPSL